MYVLYSFEYSELKGKKTLRALILTFRITINDVRTEKEKKFIFFQQNKFRSTYDIHELKGNLFILGCYLLYN